MPTALTPHAADMELRRAKALSLRARHATYRQIAQALACDVATAYRLVQGGLLELRQDATETADEIRRLELERLDDLAQGLQAKLDRQVVEVPEMSAGGVPTGRTLRYANPDELTVKTMLDIMRRRADLLGLDAPKQIGGPDGGPIPIAAVDARELLLAKVNEMASRLAAQVAPNPTASVEMLPTNGTAP